MPNLIINGATYSVPDQGTEPPWGDDLYSWCAAVTSGMLQKAGGSFILTAEVDFGGSYGLKSLYLKSRGTNPAASGIVRLANAESVSWRNAANGADLPLKANSSDRLEFNSIELVDLSTAQTLTNKSINADSNTLTNIANAAIKAAAAIDLNKLAATTASRVLVSDSSGFISASNITSTTLGYLDATSSIQTQLNTKLTNPLTTTGDIIYQSGGGATRLAIGTTNQVLAVSAGGIPEWKSAGSGDVVGPGSSTDNAIPRFDGTGGKTLQGSGVTIDDSNNLAAPGNITATGYVQGQFNQLITYTTSGSPHSYTPAAGTKKIKVTVVGAGGGGGGCAGTGSGIGAAGAGGSGAVSIRWMNVSDLTTPVTVTVGSGGNGGSAGNNNGSAGGTSSFGSYCSATGGSGGDGAVGDSSTHSASGGAGGTAADGDINLEGSAGVTARTNTTPLVINAAGASGNSIVPAQPPSASSGTGTTASYPGGGGGGGRRFSSGVANQAGANGRSGLVWIEEYY